MDDIWQKVTKLDFNISIRLFLQVPTLHYKKTRLKKYNLLGFDRLCATDFLALREIVCVATHTMETTGAICRFVSLNRLFQLQGGVNCAGQTKAAGMAGKRSFHLVVSLDNFLCILIWRSLSNLKEKFTTAFRHKRIHTALHSPKQVEVEWPQARKCRQCSTTPGDYYITHSMHVEDDVLYSTLHAAEFATTCCNNFEFMIHLMIVGLLNTALFQCLKCHDKRISKNCRSTFILGSWWNVWGGPFFAFCVPEGATVTPAPRQLRHWSDVW